MSAKQRSRGKVKRRSTTFKVYIQLPLDSPRLCLDGLTTQTKVSSLKARLDKDAGLLPQMYHLSYLDAAPLEEDSTLQENDIIAGATLHLMPWRSWADLLKAAYLGDINDCFACSVNIAGDSDWSRHCAWSALYIASHRGHHLLVAKLLERTSLLINTVSSCGRTVLHAAARMGHWKTLCVLLDNGADVRIKDANKNTAFDIARQNGHGKCEHSLNFCQWNLQKHHIIRERKTEYDPNNARRTAEREAHQYADSTSAPGLRGPRGQVYMFQTPNPVTVRDVKTFKVEKPDEEEEPTIPITDSSGDERRKLEFNYGWFDPLRAQQLIPSTHDVLTYSNPSSCHLRPKSILNPGGYTASRHKPVRKQTPVSSATTKPKGGGARR